MNNNRRRNFRPRQQKIIIGEETDLLTYLIQIILRIMAILTSIETDQ